MMARTSSSATGRVLALVAALLLVASSPRPAAAHTEPVVAEVSVRPANPVPDEEVEIRVVLRGANSGLPVLGAEVSVVADMPMHKMMPVRATLYRGRERNEHVGKLRFTMAGPWVVTLNVQHQGERDQAEFGLEVKEPTATRDEGAATYALLLDFPSSGFAYPGVVLAGSVLLMAAIVEAAWINKRFRKPKAARRR